MEKVISNYFETEWTLTDRTQYKFWRYNRSKYCQWVKYKRKDYQGIDVWDHTILKTKLPGTTVVYDSQAIYWKRLCEDVHIIENSVPKLVEPFVELLNPKLDASLAGKVNNLILFRPLSVKLTTSLRDYLSVPMITRSGHTPNFLTWLANDAKLYISVGQEFFSFNRFKYTLLDFIDLESQKLYNEFGLKLVLKTVSKNDWANGNIKLIFERQ